MVVERVGDPPTRLALWAWFFCALFLCAAAPMPTRANQKLRRAHNPKPGATRLMHLHAAAMTAASTSLE